MNHKAYILFGTATSTSTQLLTSANSAVNQAWLLNLRLCTEFWDSVYLLPDRWATAHGNLYSTSHPRPRGAGYLSSVPALAGGPNWLQPDVLRQLWSLHADRLTDDDNRSSLPLYCCRCAMSCSKQTIVSMPPTAKPVGRSADALATMEGKWQKCRLFVKISKR